MEAGKIGIRKQNQFKLTMGKREMRNSSLSLNWEIDNLVKRTSISLRLPFLSTCAVLFLSSLFVRLFDSYSLSLPFRFSLISHFFCSKPNLVDSLQLQQVKRRKRKSRLLRRFFRNFFFVVGRCFRFCW